MKILLIQPPVDDFYQTSIRTQPIGLAYLAASLKKSGHEVGILDCQTDEKRSNPVPSELSYLKEYYPFDDHSPFKLYTGFYHFGMDWKEISKRIRKSGADLFGISSSFTPYHGEALKVAWIVKEWDKDKIVVMGGSHVSGDPNQVLQNPLIDYIVLGEGEVRFPMLLEQLQKNKKNFNGIDGIGYRKDGDIRINPLQNFVRDLDGLPPPARELLPPDRYRIGKKRSAMIITSRGCPHRCAYCSAHLVMGPHFRMRSPEAVVREMVECQQQYGIEIFDIEDDNFTFDQARAKRLMQMINSAFGEGKIELTAMNGVSYASLDGELLGLMKRAGFNTINLSFVSTDPASRERLKRPKEQSDFNQVLKDAGRLGLNVVAYAILGLPGQTVGEMVDTLVDLMGKRVLIGPSVYYPTPGTPLFDRCRADGILPPHLSRWRSSAFPIETKEFSRLDIITLFRLARFINSIKGKMDQGELSEGMDLKEIGQALRVETPFREGMDRGTGMKPVLSHEKGKETFWRDLFFLFFEERSFASLKRTSGKGFFLEREKTSKTVLDYFFDRSQAKPVLKSRAD